MFLVNTLLMKRSVPEIRFRYLRLSLPIDNVSFTALLFYLGTNRIILTYHTKTRLKIDTRLLFRNQLLH